MKHAVAVLLLLAALPLWAGKKFGYPPVLVKRDPQSAEIAELKVPKLKQDCPNWEWAAAVELMLEQQHVAEYKQDYWVTKSAGGELCIEKPIDLDQLKQWVDGDYKLDDGTDAHFEATVTAGAPQDVSHFVQGLKDGKTALLLWKGKPYLLKAIEYDEYVYPNGQRMFEARKLTLVDPVSKEPVVFEKLKDDMADIGGMLEVKVGPIEHWR
jgi:hypothetical protein